jgi:hypothetical protein
LIITRMAVLLGTATGSRRARGLKHDGRPAEVLFVGHWLDALAKASTGHRERHRTNDSGTESPPETRRPVENSVAPVAQGMTRRALLRRGAVVGAVVWTTPVLQTALAPAASASHCTNCVGIGGSCDPNHSTAECQVGLVCLAGVCLVDGGSSGCTTSNQCASGVCSGGVCLAWPGTTCTSGTQCASGKCTGGVCFANGRGGRCKTTADCTDNTQCGPTGVCGGAGAPCANKEKCVSRVCTNGGCFGGP